MDCNSLKQALGAREKIHVVCVANRWQVEYESKPLCSLMQVLFLARVDTSTWVCYLRWPGTEVGHTERHYGPLPTANLLC